MQIKRPATQKDLMRAIYQLTSKVVTINAKLQRVPYLAQLAFFYFLTYANMIFFIPIAMVLLGLGKYSLPHPKVDVFSALIVASLVETLIFQLLVFQLLNFTWLKNKPFIVFAVSSILFGLSHAYSTTYILWASMQGVVLALTYYFFLPNTTKAYWSTAIVHCARNATTLALLQLFNM